MGHLLEGALDDEAGPSTLSTGSPGASVDSVPAQDKTRSGGKSKAKKAAVLKKKTSAGPPKPKRSIWFDISDKDEEEAPLSAVSGGSSSARGNRPSPDEKYMLSEGFQSLQRSSPCLRNTLVSPALNSPEISAIRSSQPSSATLATAGLSAAIPPLAPSLILSGPPPGQADFQSCWSVA